MHEGVLAQSGSIAITNRFVKRHKSIEIFNLTDECQSVFFQVYFIAIFVF